MCAHTLSLSEADYWLTVSEESCGDGTGNDSQPTWKVRIMPSLGLVQEKEEGGHSAWNTKEFVSEWSKGPYEGTVLWQLWRKCSNAPSKRTNVSVATPDSHGSMWIWHTTVSKTVLSILDLPSESCWKILLWFFPWSSTQRNSHTQAREWVKSTGVLCSGLSDKGVFEINRYAPYLLIKNLF